MDGTSDGYSCLGITFIDMPNSINKSDYPKTDKIRKVSKFKIIKTPSSYPEKRELMTQGCSERGQKEAQKKAPHTDQ